MSQRDDDRFRVRPGAPKQRGDAFINQVLRQTSKAGAKAGKAMAKAGRQPGARLGRGHVAARFAGRGLGANARRVTIKARLVNLAQAGARTTAAHLRYIEREGVDRQGGPDRAYGPMTDAANLEAFKARSADDRHQFRFIVSPEDAEQLDNLRTYTRHLMARMEADLGTRLEWVAVDHWNTDNPHTHVVLRGKDDTGKDLIIARDYIAGECATGHRNWRRSGWATHRTGDPARHAARGGTGAVDRAGPQLAARGRGRFGTAGDVGRTPAAAPAANADRPPATLAANGPGDRAAAWHVDYPCRRRIHAAGNGRARDIIRTMQRTMSGRQRELAVFQPSEYGRTIVGSVVGKGLADELYDKGYLVLDGIDGKAHYVALPPRSELEQYPTGAVVEVKGSADVRVADRNIAALAVDGVYRTDHHLAVAQGQATPSRDPHEVVAAHVRRLEALRRAGIVERVAEGVWRVPDDLAERGRQYDAHRLSGGVAAELKSHLPVERQARVIGATWLDQQLIGGGKGLGDLGFGGEVKDALRQRADFLIEQGLAERRGQRVILARNLLATLRGRELAKTAQDIATETGLEHRQVVDGQRVTGTYRRSVMLASGRFAMLDDGVGFSLVPWKPVIEQRLGRQLAATVRSGGVSWQIGRQRGLAV
ncbi:relaxase [Pseudomonas aeruginosa]|nr:relaxase [Pseudomonas aeruginosa]